MRLINYRIIYILQYKYKTEIITIIFILQTF